MSELDCKYKAGCFFRGTEIKNPCLGIIVYDETSKEFYANDIEENRICCERVDAMNIVLTEYRKEVCIL